MQKPSVPQGNITPQISASRAAPPLVPFVMFEGIKYRQVLNANVFGKDQRTGYLAAYEGEGEEPLWLLRVYETTKVDQLEQDVQEVYFLSMGFDMERRQLHIENELGNSFIVDIDDKSVSKIK